MKRAETNAGNTPAAQAGFTLIEVLVSLLILAIGLLGVAALQFRGLQYNHDAYMRSQINVLVYDIADRMRLNAANAADYLGAYDSQLMPDPDDLTDMNNVCDEAAATAANDLACWHNSVDRSLPPESIATIAAAGPTDTYTVTLQWNDREGNAHSVSYTFRI
jgi:type IV pilus assembly protein PilV